MSDDLNIRRNLALAYQIFSYLKLDDHTYTHLSSRPEKAEYYYIYPFGLRFEEVTADSLLKVSLNGEILSGSEYQYNKTGYIIHGNIYKARGNINHIFHFHTPAGVAVSAMKDGLLPISQWALHFFERISYHNYDSLALEQVKHGNKLIEDLGRNYVMLLRNHGGLTCGKTIYEAMFYAYHLELACKTQCLALQSKQELFIPTKEVCEKAVKDLLTFEQDLGKRDWLAWERVVKNALSSRT